MADDWRHTPFVLLLSKVFSICGPPSPSETAFNRGVDYATQGDYENAIKEYDEAIRLDPQFAIAYINRGSAYTDLEQYERAIEDYDEAIRLDPQADGAYWGRGWVYGHLGLQELAARDIAKAKSLGVD